MEQWYWYVPGCKVTIRVPEVIVPVFAGSGPGPLSHVRVCPCDGVAQRNFDSNVIDLVVAALPLRQGLKADLPFFIYERGGRVSIPVAVRERATVAFATIGSREVWVVAVDVPGAPATVWVDTRTHAILRVRYDIMARAMSFTDERVTPLHG